VDQPQSLQRALVGGHFEDVIGAIVQDFDAPQPITPERVRSCRE
jgi:hypothetical protein